MFQMILITTLLIPCDVDMDARAAVAIACSLENVTRQGDCGNNGCSCIACGNNRSCSSTQCPDPNCVCGTGSKSKNKTTPEVPQDDGNLKGIPANYRWEKIDNSEGDQYALIVDGEHVGCWSVEWESYGTEKSGEWVYSKKPPVPFKIPNIQYYNAPILPPRRNYYRPPYYQGGSVSGSVSRSSSC